MGHIKRKRPRRGSKQYWPRKRAQRLFPKIRNWTRKKQPTLLGFAGYKAGMTAVTFIDNRPKSPTKGEEVLTPVTILEAPPLKIAAVRLYRSTPYGLKAIAEVWIDKLDKELSRAILLPKKRKLTIEDLKKELPRTTEVRVMVYTQPRITGLRKKKPEILEIAIGGTVQEQFDYATSVLGKEVSISDVFKEGEFLDVHAVTKGKGFQGDIKRFGIKLESHKAEFGRRHRGTMGPITPHKVRWWIAQPGQMGFHTRTEYNKQLLKIGDVKSQPVTPVSGFAKYGKVNGIYMLIAGSIPGPKKRLIRLTHATRLRKGAFIQAPEIIHVSLRSQQG